MNTLAIACPDHDIQSPVRRVLAGIAQRPTAWPAAEAALAGALPGGSVYLGGDGLRPYACHVTGGHVCLAGVQPGTLPVPLLAADVLAGTYGPAVVEYDPGDSRFYTARLRHSEPLARRLDVPHVLLIGLGDAERYRGARLALGVARLAQWLRFTHAARATVVDYNFDADPVAAVTDLLADRVFGIVGISVNFGQWAMLEQLATLIAGQADLPLVVLGNILASFSPGRAASLFRPAGRPVVVATGLGERPLEQLCRAWRDPDAWDAIPGLIRPAAGAAAPAGVMRREAPPELVFPDDGLVLEVARRGGQVSFETSFGCQYGACTFCPRDHRGEGWSRDRSPTVIAALERLAGCGAVVSLVDEEFFGAEGLADPPPPDPPAALILAACRRLGICYELYTRLEQLFDRRRSAQWNLARARLLATEAPAMRRIFVGVESGSPSQLRRYGKGQTIAQTTDALRVASMLGVPLEFGFITFDPLLMPGELADNIEFLARDDVIAAPGPPGMEDRLGLVAGYLAGHAIPVAGTPLYRHVAYMATELEVLVRSRYAAHLHRRHPELLDGSYDPGFARYGVRYRDSGIAEIAGWCRVWTEGMFTSVYQARMIARACADPAAARPATQLVARYRDATFTLITALTRLMVPELCGRLDALTGSMPMPAGGDPAAWLRELAARTLPGGPPVRFDVNRRRCRRDR